MRRTRPSSSSDLAFRRIRWCVFSVLFCPFVGNRVLNCAIQNMGQRFVQLQSTYTGNPDGTAVLHVSQLPPNPAILVPGPACKWNVSVCLGTEANVQNRYIRRRQWCSFHRCRAHGRLWTARNANDATTSISPVPYYHAFFRHCHGEARPQERSVPLDTSRFYLRLANNVDYFMDSDDDHLGVLFLVTYIFSSLSSSTDF
jgi:hypothetical protein